MLGLHGKQYKLKNMIYIIYVILLFVWSYRDFIDIEKNEDIEHGTGLIMYGLSTALIIPFSWIDFVICFLLGIALFDAMLNLLRDKDIFYLGDTAKWDVFWKKRITIYKAVKLLSLLAAVILIFTT